MKIGFVDLLPMSSNSLLLSRDVIITKVNKVWMVVNKMLDIVEPKANTG
jgi:hypothetical protein